MVLRTIFYLNLVICIQSKCGLGLWKGVKKLHKVNDIWEICCGQLSIHDFRRLLWWFILFYLLWLTVPSIRPTFTLYNTKQFGHFALSIFVKLNILFSMKRFWIGITLGEIMARLSFLHKPINFCIYNYIHYSPLQNSTMVYISPLFDLYHILPFYIRLIPLLINYNILKITMSIYC